MSKVSVNPPKTPVTKGSSGVAAATIPNVCKMPGPPAPFVPVPLPNIGKSGNSPKGYSKKVKIEGNAVAIKGATFKSIGDIASKGTGGGLISANTHGPTKFVGPGSLDVKIEGKNVQLLADPMLNNCGSSGSPPNSATLVGVLQMTGMVAALKARKCPICDADHEKVEESRRTKRRAKNLADAFEAELGGAAASTMLAVLHCACGKEEYASNSGAVARELCDAATELGMQHPVEWAREICTQTYAPGLPSMAEIMSNLLELRQDISEHADAFQDAWEEAEKKSKAFNSDRANNTAAYPPGACAAQKALILLLSEGNAIAGDLTERWYSSAGHSVTKIRVLVEVPPQPHHKKARPRREPRVMTFAPGDTVPPCESCNLLLPFLTCADGKCHG